MSIESLLQQPISRDEIDNNTSRISQPREATVQKCSSICIFRLSEEFFAIPSACIKRIMPMVKRQLIPHRQHLAASSLFNFDGKICVCLDLHHLLKIDRSPKIDQSLAGELIVLNQGKEVTGIAVDEVVDVAMIDLNQLMPVPGTISRGRPFCGTELFVWKEKYVLLVNVENLDGSLKAAFI